MPEYLELKVLNQNPTNPNMRLVDYVIDHAYEIVDSENPES